MKEQSIHRSCGSSSGNGSLQSGGHRKTTARQNTIRSQRAVENSSRERDGELGADRRDHRTAVETGRVGVEMIHYLRALAASLRGLFRDRSADRDFDDEIEAHLRLL